MRPSAFLVLLVLGCHFVPRALPAQEPTWIPPGHVLVDDMILPEEVVLGESAFTATPWPQDVVFYEFAANVSAANQTIARKAMADIAAVAGVIFVPHTTTPNWIVFNASTVNNSFVGMQGGAQIINITSWGVKYIVVHEIMHALGYVHEQCRPDRDAFVSINWANISATACPGSNCGAPGSASCVCNFNIVNGAAMPTPYDFLSIMHYNRTAFTTNGQDTITCQPAFAAFQNQIGNRTFMTLSDADGLQARYGLPNVYPSITSISPPFVTTSLPGFLLHVYGADFHEGSPNANGVQGTKITWNGAIIPTTYEDDGHLTAQIPASLIAEPQQVQISVTNPAPGNGNAISSQTLSVICQSGGLALQQGVPVSVTNGCQGFSITPVYNAFNVVAVSPAGLLNDWNIQMGSAISASGGNECDFVAGGGFFGAGSVTPTNGNLTFGSGFSPARLVHVGSAPLQYGFPTISSIPAGGNVAAFHFQAFSAGNRIIQVAGPSNLRWKLVGAGGSFSWRSSETQATASGTVGGGPVTAGVGSGHWCLVVYKNGSPVTTTTSFTISMCFDFTPAQLTSGGGVTSINGANATCVPFTISPLAGRFNVVGISSAADWDLQIGPAVSQYGGNSCDYVLADGRLGAVSPVTGVCAPYVATASFGELEFGRTTTVPPALGSQSAPAADVIEAFEFEVVTPGNYDIRVSATGYNWNLHGPGVSSAWRAATDRIAGPFAPATTYTIPNLDIGWHCIVVYHNGGFGSHGLSHSVLVNYSAAQAPALSSISPDVAPANGPTFTLSAYGTGFTPASEVRWNGAALATVYVSDTELAATVDNLLLAAPGTASVSVVTPGAGSSGSLPFTIGNPVPVLASITPDFVTAGEPTFTLTVYGSDFVPGAEVQWNATPLLTTFISSTELQAVADSSLFLYQYAWPIGVVNPGPGGGESNYVYITVYGPQISYLVPASIPIQPPASPAFNLGVNGIGFNAWSVVHANGIPLPTTYIDIYTLDAVLDPNLFSQASVPGAIEITVANTVEGISPVVGLVVDSGNNAGFVRAHPLALVPGQPFSLRIETAAPFSPFTLVADAGSPVPFNNWPDPGTNLVLGVTELAGSSGLWVPLVDGIGVFGAPSGAALDISGYFELPGFTMPAPAIGVNVTLQAIYLDPAAPLGFNLTFPYHALVL